MVSGELSSSPLALSLPLIERFHGFKFRMNRPTRNEYSARDPSSRCSNPILRAMRERAVLCYTGAPKTRV